MDKTSKVDRIVYITNILTQNPMKLYNFNYFCERFGCAKSTLSEDIDHIDKVLRESCLGKIVSVSGAAGGIYYEPDISREEACKFLEELSVTLSNAERIVPGGFVYINDIIYNPDILKNAAKIFYRLFNNLQIDYIATVEAKGIALASAVSSIMNKPLVVARNSSKLTEGSTVNIYYVSGTTGKIETMTIAKKAIKRYSKVIFIDDFMRGGGTAKGIKELLSEFDSELVGVGVLISTGEIKDASLNIKSLLTLDKFNLDSKIINFKANYNILW